ncbi:MAG: CvpA family protein [Spirochaetales bacterium]|nr:CvpA family protein [Spirochaetales bacterium]
MELAAVDFVFAIAVVILALRAAIRGFVKELLGTAALILGIVAAVLFSGLASGLIDDLVGSSVWSQVIAFLGIFLIVYLVMKIFEGALNRLIERIHLNQLDHALGLFLGIVEGIVVVFVFLLLIQIQPFFEPETLIGGSLFARVLVPFLPFAAEFFRTGRLSV